MSGVGVVCDVSVVSGVSVVFGVSVVPGGCVSGVGQRSAEQTYEIQ